MPDGTYAGYHANNIIENIYNSVDDNRHTESISNEIIDHCQNAEAIHKRDWWLRSQPGMSKRVVTDGRVGGQSFLYTWLHCECYG